MPEIPLGADHPAAGRAAYDWLIAAIDLTRSGAADAIATAPLSKAALHAGRPALPGAHGNPRGTLRRAGLRDDALPAGRLTGRRWTGRRRGVRAGHCPRHAAHLGRIGPWAAEYPRPCGRRSDWPTAFLRRLGCPAPRVGVCALNPHGGEGGIFGDEEARLIAPAVREAVTAGVAAAGPYPADTLLRRAVLGEFDAAVAMYHDQGHIAVKLLGFGTAVNVTLGLPIIRTSPSHGTAFDIAGRGVADGAGMVEAVRVAARLVRTR